MKNLGRTKTVSLAALSFLLLAFVMGPAPVLNFTASIDPTEAIAGVQEDFEILITNTGSGSGGSATIQSVAIHIPSGFTVDGTSLGTSNGWPVTIDGEYITAYKIGSTEIPAGGSITISFSATASAAGTYEWTTSAFHGDDWTTPCAIQGEQPTVTVTALDFYFAGWRPPVINHLDDESWQGWESGSTMPVKFLVVDEDGNPVIAGVVATVKIGDSDEVPAVLDDAEIGQWIAEVVLVGSGIQDVTITGNVTDVTPLSILVKENP
jgi:hypothetical protein